MVDMKIYLDGEERRCYVVRELLYIFYCTIKIFLTLFNLNYVNKFYIHTYMVTPGGTVALLGFNRAKIELD